MLVSHCWILLPQTKQWTSCLKVCQTGLQESSEYLKMKTIETSRPLLPQQPSPERTCTPRMKWAKQVQTSSTPPSINPIITSQLSQRHNLPHQVTEVIIQQYHILSKTEEETQPLFNQSIAIPWTHKHTWTWRGAHMPQAEHLKGKKTRLRCWPKKSKIRDISNSLRGNRNYCIRGQNWRKMPY